MSPLLNRQRVSVAAVLSAMAMVVLDASLVNVALPTIATSLNELPGATILVVSVYQAALLVGLLPAAHIAERVGYRRLFVAGLVLFTGASVLCAFAPTLASLVVARILQGLGGAAIMSLGIALLRFALGADRLPAAIGWNALTVALCSAAGPVAGAFILSVAPWPWLFLAKLPVSAIALAAATGLPKVAPTRTSVDWRGIAFHAASAAMVVIAAQSVILHPYLAIVVAGIGVAVAVLLVRRERHRPAPLLPIDLLALRPFRVSVAASVCCFTGQSAGLIALPLYLQLSLGKGALASAFVLTCWPISVVVASRFANPLAARFGAPALCAAGASLLGAALLVSALLPVHGQIGPLAAGRPPAASDSGCFRSRTIGICFCRPRPNGALRQEACRAAPAWPARRSVR